MGDWFLNNAGKWTYDANAPGPRSGVEATSMLPAVKQAEAFTKDDGTVYERAVPAWFQSHDEIDSTTIIDDGGPPDAA